MKTAAKSIQICGTGSGVGKSVITAAFCRIFRQDGYKVAPFKAQNMALNSFVTAEGGEIGRAQAMQAEAAQTPPSVDMNPILIKPTADTRAQIILRGKPIADMSAAEYSRKKIKFLSAIDTSYKRLADKYEIIVIEGAGSLAEINLKENDLANTSMAKKAGAPIIIAADIDKGGVFASLIGTMELLDSEEKSLVAGFIINKFRGDKRLLKGGLNFLERKTGKKVFGVIPFFIPGSIRLPEEDSVALEKLALNKYAADKINIDILYLPHISNFTDFDALEKEPDVNLNYIRDTSRIKNPDVLIIPGSKNTIHDMMGLKRRKFGKKLRSLSAAGCEIVGICGGYQMLGTQISDSLRVESKTGATRGFGLLDITTEFKNTKSLFQVNAKDLQSGVYLRGYEIHHGRSYLKSNARPLFQITRRNSSLVNIADGASNTKGNIWGTYIHGIFDNPAFRRKFIDKLCRRKNLKTTGKNADNTDSFDSLADLVRSNTDMRAIYKLIDRKNR